MSHSSQAAPPQLHRGSFRLPGPHLRALGLRLAVQSLVLLGRPPRHFPAGRPGGPAATGTPRRPHSGSGRREAAPVTRLQLHKAQGGGGRGGSACDRGGAARRGTRGAEGAGLGPPPLPGEEAGAQRAEPGAAAGGCKRRPGLPCRPSAPSSSPPGPQPEAPRPEPLGPRSLQTAGVNPSSKAQKLPPYRGECEQRAPVGPAAGRATTRDPSQAAPSPVLLPGGQSEARQPHAHRPWTAKWGAGPDDPRGLFRPGIVGGSSARPRH